MLEGLDLSPQLGDKEYSDELARLRPRLLRLQRACWSAGLGSLIVFEGWAFSGRGRAIRTLTQRLEPRGFARKPDGSIETDPGDFTQRPPEGDVNARGDMARCDQDDGISAPSILRMSAGSARGYRYENASISTRLACRLKKSVSDLIA